MAGPTPEPMTLLARLEVLDSRLRQARRVGIYALVFIVIALGLLTIGVVRSREEPRELYLRDEAGKPRAWLGMAKGEPGLEFYGEDGKVVVGFKITKDDTGLLFLDGDQKVRAKFGLTQGQPSLVLYGANGKQRVDLADAKDSRALILMDDNEKPRASLAVDKKGPHLIMNKEQGKKPARKP